MTGVVLWPCLVFVVLTVVTGLYCVLGSANFIRILIGIEIMMKGMTLFLITSGSVNGRLAQAQSFVITLIVLEVVVMVVGGGIALSLYRSEQSIHTESLSDMKG